MTEIQKLLNAREERDSIKKKLSESGTILISLNLNIPGIPKSNHLLTSFFDVVKDQLKNWLLANRIFIDDSKEINTNHEAGDYYVVPLKTMNYKATYIKQITEQFEESHSLGRFIDVDVVGESGENISSGKSKICFFCREFPAIECRRSERHSIDEIRKFQEEKITKYLKKNRLDEICKKVTNMASQAIFYEISLTPKPGLVDKDSSGVHSDMDYRTFIDSTVIISSYFQDLILAGINCKTKNLSNALPLIRQIGLQMEKEMFANTHGVNTQKGLIFLMGVSLFASGYILRKNNSFNPAIFRQTVQKICENMVQTELQNTNDALKSHGEQCFNQFKVAGIRWEAENGFPSVFDHALPLILDKNSTEDKALIMTLLSIMSQLDDTNVLYRSNSNTLNLLKEKCKMVLDNYSFDKYQEILDFCKTEKISPGGSADLLSITVFIYLMIKNFP